MVNYNTKEYYSEMRLFSLFIYHSFIQLKVWWINVCFIKWFAVRSTNTFECCYNSMQLFKYLNVKKFPRFATTVISFTKPQNPVKCVYIFLLKRVLWDDDDDDVVMNVGFVQTIEEIKLYIYKWFLLHFQCNFGFCCAKVRNIKKIVIEFTYRF